MTEDLVSLRLSQLGALVSDRWAKRLRTLELTPSQGAVLRAIAGAQPLSQRELAELLGIVPSRVVPVIDSLEAKGWVTRTRSQRDRRRQELTLTDAGTKTLERLRRASADHEEEIAHPLDDDQRTQLAELLGALAEAHGLSRTGHPRLGNARRA